MRFIGPRHAALSVMPSALALKVGNLVLSSVYQDGVRDRRAGLQPAYGFNATRGGVNHDGGRFGWLNVPAGAHQSWKSTPVASKTLKSSLAVFETTSLPHMMRRYSQSITVTQPRRPRAGPTAGYCAGFFPAGRAPAWPPRLRCSRAS